MENQTPVPNFFREDELKMLMEIYTNTRKAKNYMKWQLIITVALVVIPLLGMAFLIPTLLSSLTNVYGGTLIQ